MKTTLSSVLSWPQLFRNWSVTGRPQSSRLYFRGHLAVAREHDPKANAIGYEAFEAYKAGRVHLVQRRKGPHDFEYWAVKT